MGAAMRHYSRVFLKVFTQVRNRFVTLELGYPFQWLSKDEIGDYPALELYEPSLVPRLLQRLRHPPPGEALPPPVEAVMVRQDNSRVPVELSTANLVLEGRIIGRVAVAHDISERKQAAEDHVERERLQTLSRRHVEVQEAERRHLARELHDEVGQLLTGLKFVLERAMRSPSTEAKARLREAQTLVTDLMTQVRELSLDLRPALLDDLGLLSALLWLFDRYHKRTQVRVVFEHRELDRRFPPEVETAAYRIVQEALTNAARHAGVSGVTVGVWSAESLLHVQIEDRGPGFDVQAVLGPGTTAGLAGMYERARLLGGQLIVKSTPGNGTRITAELPLDVAHRGEQNQRGYPVSG
jgi:signal transduction histidine kinase